jgi:hypothetical protein
MSMRTSLVNGKPVMLNYSAKELRGRVHIVSVRAFVRAAYIYAQCTITTRTAFSIECETIVQIASNICNYMLDCFDVRNAWIVS